MFPKSAEGWQRAWAEFEWLESHLPSAPPPPAPTRKPGRSRRKGVVTAIAVLGVAIAVIAAAIVFGGEDTGQDTLFVTDDFAESRSDLSDLDNVEYLDGTLHIHGDSPDVPSGVSVEACQRYRANGDSESDDLVTESCGIGTAGLRVEADVWLASPPSGAGAGAGIGCENRDSGIGYGFLLVSGSRPTFEIFGRDGVLATAAAPSTIRFDRPNRLEARCISGPGGAGTTLVLRVNGKPAIRFLDHTRDHTFYDGLDLFVQGAGTEGVFDNVVMREG
jgi:hypothetical protein